MSRPVARRIALTLAVAALACAPSQGQQSGQAVYQTNCAGCHGLDGRGGEHAPDIATVQRLQRLTRAELLRTIRNGVPGSGMPAFGARLTHGQLTAVAGYLRSLQGAQTSVPLPGNPDTGRGLFFNKAGCSACHMADGQGGFLADDLSSYAATHSIEQIREAILNPNNNLDPRHAFAAVATNDGRQYTGVIRNEDSFSLQLQSRDGAFHLFEKSSLADIKRERRSIMPANYGSTLSPQDLDDLIGYLLRIASTQPKQTEDNSEW
ncbi:MAG TPA: c-type cytochrome [Bryobacteraceae bacterium]|jgi:putative heme-binding domain-containing protein|nr:c-type cytochrome [Bryobacteraceae bacterium]